MGSFQIRGETHRLGSLHVTETLDGKILLDGAGTEDYIDVGDPEDALLVAKCLEVFVRRKVSPDLAEASERSLEKALEQIKADHKLTTEP